MPTKTTTAHKAPAAAKTATKAPEAKEPAQVVVPALEEVSDDDFPTTTRMNTALSPWLDTVAALVNGKKFALSVETKEEADKIGSQIRQVMRRLHQRALTAVFVPNEKRLYVKDGGTIKARKPAENGK